MLLARFILVQPREPSGMMGRLTCRRVHPRVEGEAKFTGQQSNAVLGLFPRKWGSHDLPPRLHKHLWPISASTKKLSPGGKCFRSSSTSREPVIATCACPRREVHSRPSGRADVRDLLPYGDQGLSPCRRGAK
jgi:hypothetical protein